MPDTHTEMTGTLALSGLEGEPGIKKVYADRKFREREREGQ